MMAASQGYSDECTPFTAGSSLTITTSSSSSSSKNTSKVAVAAAMVVQLPARQVAMLQHYNALS